MRAALAAILIATIFLPAVAAAELTVEERQEMLARTTGTIVGVVRDAQSNKPLSGVSVSAQYLGDGTNTEGAYRIPLIDPGEVEVTAWRRDLIQSTQRVSIHAATETTANFLIERSPPPCCTLQGTWLLSLKLDESGKATPGEVTVVEGAVSFSPSARDPFPERRSRLPSDDSTTDEFGRYNIDLRPLLGEDITRATTNTVFAGNPDSDILTEAAGFVHHQNHVEITFIPRMSHGGISLTGVINDDEIRGEWVKRDYAPSISGSFVMRRSAPTPNKALNADVE